MACGGFPGSLYAFPYFLAVVWQCVYAGKLVEMDNIEIFLCLKPGKGFRAYLKFAPIFCIFINLFADEMVSGLV